MNTQQPVPTIEGSPLPSYIVRELGWDLSPVNAPVSSPSEGNATYQAAAPDTTTTSSSAHSDISPSGATHSDISPSGATHSDISPSGATHSDISPSDTTTYQDLVTGELITVGPDVNAAFESIIAEQQWLNSLSQYPPEERVEMLRAAPIGIDLMSELQLIDTTKLNAEQRLIYSHLWQRCVGWVNLQAAHASAEFIEAVENPPENRPFTRDGVDIAPGVCVREVAVATGLSDGKAGMQIVTGAALADDGPLADTAAALRAGRISWEVANAFVYATMGLNDEQARAVQNLVLPRAVAPIDPETGEGCWRSRSWAIKALRRALIVVDPDTVIRQREEAQARRRIDIYPEPETGMAYLSAYLPAVEALSVYNTLTALAEGIRRDDTVNHPDERPRAWATARADALIMCVQNALAELEQTGAVPTNHGKTRIEIGVIIDYPTLMNLADHPGEILGYGPIDPEYARLLAAGADTWRRWVIEPVTGHLLDYGRTTYRPPQELRDYLLAAYPECSKPECTVHSKRADFDHALEWHDDGDTSAANLHPLCRTDHVDKTTGWSDARVNPDGTVTHTTRHGLTRTNEPYWKPFADDLNRDRDIHDHNDIDSHVNEVDDEIPPF